MDLSLQEVHEFAGICEAIAAMEDGKTLTVLDPESGKMIEHRQLRRDPRYKDIWDQSYSNELGRYVKELVQARTWGGNRWQEQTSFI